MTPSLRLKNVSSFGTQTLTKKGYFRITKGSIMRIYDFCNKSTSPVVHNQKFEDLLTQNRYSIDKMPMEKLETFKARNSTTLHQPITEPVGFHKTCPQWAKLLLNILCYCRCDLSRNYFSEGKIEIALHFSYLAS